MFESVTPETIKAGLLAELPGWNTAAGSFANTLVSATAFEIWKCYEAMNALVPMFYVDETSGEYIDKKCGEYGILRKPGAKATVILNFTGGVGVLVPSGSVFLTDDGHAFLTDSSCTLTTDGGSVSATAADVGTAYNVDAGTIVSAQISIGGLSAVTNQEAAAGGVDPETDEALCKRLYDFLRQPATSGNAYHYKQWAMEITGVGFAKVTPLWDGPGTVKVLIASPEGEAVESSVVSETALYIESQRPIGAMVTVLSASELAINVAATVTIDGSTTKAAVQTAFANAVGAYLKTLAFQSYTVNYNRISFLLLSIPGVTDYTALTVNGGTSNVTVGESQVPVAGTVVVS